MVSNRNRIRAHNLKSDRPSKRASGKSRTSVTRSRKEKLLASLQKKQQRFREPGSSRRGLWNRERHFAQIESRRFFHKVLADRCYPRVLIRLCCGIRHTTAHGDDQRKANREFRFSAHVSSSFCYAVFSVQCSVAGAAHLPSSIHSCPPLAESRKCCHTSELDGGP